MKTLGIVSLLSVPVLAALACNVTGFLPSSIPPSATVAPTVATEPPGQPIPALTVEELQNMQVTLQNNDQHPKVQLADGVYQAGDQPPATDFVSVNMPDMIAFGDLNHDGISDAAALLAENYGGTGVYTSVLAILNVNGGPVQVGAYMIDDRPMPSGLVIEDGKIIFSGAIHAPNDPGCCPSMPVTETLALTKGGLQRVRMSSTTPTGQERAITIVSPKDGDQVAAGYVPVKGGFTISPFENTFACKIVDATGKEWFSGPLTVTAELGQPGSIDNQIDFSMVPAGVLVRLEIMDASAADGSTLAMDSVELMIK